MPFSLRIEPGSGVVIGTCSGILNATDAREGAATFWANREWSGRPIVWDFRSATTVQIFRDYDEAVRWAMGPGSMAKESE